MSPVSWFLCSVLLLTNLCHAENVREIKVQVGQLYCQEVRLFVRPTDKGNPARIYRADTAD